MILGFAFLISSGSMHDVRLTHLTDFKTWLKKKTLNTLDVTSSVIYPTENRNS
jgi:hypothetical protein